MYSLMTLIFPRYGTAFAFISQIALGASVWISFTQWLWKTLSERDKVMNVDGLNACFDADRSVFSLLNLEMLTKLRTGSLIAAFAWYRISSRYGNQG